MKAMSKRFRLLIFLLILLAAGLLTSLLAGSVKTNLQDLWNFIINHNKTYATIFLNLRLPRALLAFLVGASLSLSGAILQGYFQNPMADPFVVGVSSGASVGAVLAINLGLNLQVFGFSCRAFWPLPLDLPSSISSISSPREKGCSRSKLSS